MQDNVNWNFDNALTLHNLTVTSLGPLPLPGTPLGLPPTYYHPFHIGAIFISGFVAIGKTVRWRWLTTLQVNPALLIYYKKHRSHRNGHIPFTVPGIHPNGPERVFDVLTFKTQMQEFRLAQSLN